MKSSLRRWSMATAAGAVFAGAIVGNAAAQNCAGFTDVAAASGFCPNVEWLKNRGITLGCTLPTLFCPNDAVVRLSMAAFMNRLGKALTPEILYAEAAPGALVIPSSPPLPRVCTTADSQPTVYPRYATFTASVTGLANGSPVAWRAIPSYSTDGGATWADISPSMVLRASSAPVQWSGAAPDGSIAVVPGTSFRAAISIQRDDLLAGTTGDFVDVRCQLTVVIDNANGTSSPYDGASQ
jgi:hypothetical protein